MRVRTSERDPKPEPARAAGLCECGCGGTPRPGSRFARVGCANKGRQYRTYGKRAATSNPVTLFPGRAAKPPEPEPMPPDSSWWMKPGLTRTEFMDEAERRHPGADRPRDIMPTLHAKGALRGL